MSRARFTVTAAALLIGVSTTTAATAASVTPPDRAIVVTAPRTVDADHPLTPIGTALPQSLRTSPAPAAPPVQSEHGDAIARRTGATYTVDADRAPAGPKQRGLGPAAVSPAQCAALLPSGGTRIINHFEFCHVSTSGYDVVQGGKVIGHVSWRQLTAGNIYANDRGAFFTTALDRVVRTGTTTDGLLRVDWAAGGYSGPDGSNKACDVHANPSNPALLSAWQSGATATHDISSQRADGYGRDFVSRCAIASYIRNTGGAAQIISSGMRADSASYLNHFNGAIFDRVSPVMSYSRSSTSHKVVADHIYDAQTKPASTWPTKPGKVIPGSIASGKTLSRLYEKWDAAAASQRQKNETAKNNACAPIRPTPSDGLDCDEYPFGSTWEGAGVGDNNFSVRYLDSGQNRSAGGSLAAWYAADRILHRDKFYVAISS
ncbi:NucA/NucB deoxyribonuclease domain-containing protein [Streptomyces sp. NPDC053079]|uniref:NucA/NucB deoxyribonuclease domain-containing protein n=1 Tax=Streptomyces sp. NPDC053079 TaxID=3365697 RepID=UPI0037D827B1